MIICQSCQTCEHVLYWKVSYVVYIILYMLVNKFDTHDNLNYHKSKK